MPLPNQTIFSQAEIEKMRLFVNEHDKANVSSKIHDLNNPPKEPYVHQEYPRLVYHHGNRQYLRVDTQVDHEEALRRGFNNEPFPAEAPEIELDAASASEAAELDKKLSTKKAAARK